MKVLHKTINDLGFGADFEDLRPIVTIGNFDGCHLGHQELINQCVNIAHNSQTTAMALTFEPNPKSFFQPARNFPKLFSQSQKIRAFKELGMDLLLIHSFDQELANMTAIDFYQDLLIEKLHCQGIVVGHNFYFGRNREGNTEFLHQKCQKDQIRLHVAQPQTCDSEAISSSRIRELLQAGDIELCRRMLGRPYLIEGCIEAGQQLGRKIGLPTFNIGKSEQLLPKSGVYAGYLLLNKEAPVFLSASSRSRPPDLWPVAVNIGHRPSVAADPSDIRVEAHVIDEVLAFDQHYGEKAALYLSHRLRDEQKFADLNALERQIRIDVDRARKMLQADLKLHS